MLKLSPSTRKSSDTKAFDIKSVTTTTTISKIVFTCHKIDDKYEYAIGGTGSFHFFGRIKCLSESVFRLSQKAEYPAGTFNLSDGSKYNRKLGVQVFNENDKGALPRGRCQGGKSYVCAREKGSPFGEAENFQALESPNPRTFWYLSYDPIDGQDIFELRVLDE